jgi:hypothetical protein
MRGEARREVSADGPGAEDYDAHRSARIIIASGAALDTS